MVPLVAALIKAGVPLIASAVLSKGKAVVEEKLGMTLPSAEELGFASDETRLKLKELEITHEQFLVNSILENRKLDVEQDKIDAEDRASARERETAISASENEAGRPWWVPNFISFLTLCVVLGGGYLLVIIDTSEVRYAVVAQMATVLAYYYGTNRTSKEKDVTITTLAKGVKK